MALSSSPEAIGCAAILQFLYNFRNPNVDYRAHKSPPPVPIPSKLNQVHTNPSYFSKIHFNIILSGCFFPSGFSTNKVYAFLFSPIRATYPPPPSSNGNYLENTTSYEAHQYAFHLFSIKTFYSAPRSQTLYVTVLYIPVFMFLNSRRGDKSFWAEG
jgi:hypothetical protein